MAVTPYGGLEQRLEPLEVLVQARARVAAEEFGDRAPRPARGRTVAEPNVDPGPRFFRAEPDGAGIIEDRSRLAAPGQQGVLLAVGHHGVPLQLPLARAA